MVRIIPGIIASYILGSIPTGYLFARIIKGIDIRAHGSGNMGATNVFRVIGRGPGILVLFLDALKGTLAVTVLPAVLFPHDTGVSLNLFRILSGIAAVCGHNWTVFLNFKGGKGVATSLGVVIGLSLSTPLLWSVLGISFLSFTVFFCIFRIISLSSIIASVLLPVSAFIFKVPSELAWFFLVLAVFSLWKHLPNIKRLLNGSEKKLDLSAKKRNI